MTYAPDTSDRLEQLLSEVRFLAAEYFQITGKPLGVTGEVAEYLAAKILSLELSVARTAGYDALRTTNGKVERIQIKGRALGPDANLGQRLGRIKLNAECDVVMVVLMDNATFNVREIWEAPYAAVVEALLRPGSRARERGQLGLASFKAIATQVWKSDDGNIDARTNLEGLYCPECGREFHGTWGGIDAHWKAKHDHLVPYEEAWPLIKAGTYTR